MQEGEGEEGVGSIGEGGGKAGSVAGPSEQGRQSVSTSEKNVKVNTITQYCCEKPKLVSNLLFHDCAF